MSYQGYFVQTPKHEFHANVHINSLSGQKARHGVLSSHEQHDLPVEIDEERPQKPTRDPIGRKEPHISQSVQLHHVLNAIKFKYKAACYTTVI